MKTLFFNVVFALLLLDASSQNLVPNADFEGFTVCPSAAGELYKSTGWTSFGGSPDYFNSCSSSSGADVPQNDFGFQNAASGTAYAGFTSYAAPFPIKEFIGAELSQALIPGQEYFVSFRLSAPGPGYCPTNKTGLQFSTVPYDSAHPPPNTNDVAHVFTDSVVSDTSNWILIKGRFVADSAYDYLMVGNFFTTTTGVCPQLTWIGYYFIDDVCVSADSTLCFSPVGIGKTSNEKLYGIFPNPFNERLNISAETDSEIILYNIGSGIVIRQKFSGSTSINTENLSAGIYFYEIRVDDNSIKRGKLIKN